MDPVPASATTTAVTASSLPRLAPVEMTPASRTQSNQNADEDDDRHVLAALGRIDQLEIHSAAESNRKTGYEIHIFFQPTASRIPVPVTPMAAPKQREPEDPSVQPTLQPDVIVSRSFSDFRRLRDAVYFAAHKGHDGDSTLRSCAFCASVVDAVLTDQGQPHRYHEWLLSSPAVCTLLEGFLNDLFVRALQPAASMGTRTRRTQALARPVCPVQRSTRRLMAEFLTDKIDE